MLFGSYFSKAVRYSFLITGRKDLSEDVVQETFVECYKDIKYLKDQEKFRPWFYRILVRTSWRMKAKEKHAVSLEVLDDVGRSAIDSKDDEQFNRIMNSRESSRMLRSALEKLSLPLRTTVILHYYNDLSIKEIAQILNCFQGTVKSRLHTARKLLEKQLVKDGYIYDGLECETNG
ncbi:MAG: RNA polymerase sigma factor [Bacillota bacterium]|nr:RNA polymerase sigma factor [Bacillota bacterium]